MAKNNNKILLIEDDPDQILMYTTKFELEGMNIISANTGREGIEKAKTEKPVIILLDVIINDISGVEILKALKKNKATRGINVIMLSNLAKNEIKDECLKIGASEYLIKTKIDPGDLVKKIKELI